MNSLELSPLHLFCFYWLAVGLASAVGNLPYDDTLNESFFWQAGKFLLRTGGGFISLFLLFRRMSKERDYM